MSTSSFWQRGEISNGAVQNSISRTEGQRDGSRQLEEQEGRISSIEVDAPRLRLRSRRFGVVCKRSSALGWVYVNRKPGTVSRIVVDFVRGPLEIEMPSSGPRCKS